MSVHFAPARGPRKSAVAKVLARRLRQRASNDNGEPRLTDPCFAEALRHFARHGLNAADNAHKEAENALIAGDRARYEHWHAICSVLDGRLADSLSVPIRRNG